MPTTGIDRQLAAGRGVALRDEGPALTPGTQPVRLQGKNTGIGKSVVKLALSHITGIHPGTAVSGLTGLDGTGEDLWIVAAQAIMPRAATGQTASTQPSRTPTYQS